MNSQGAESATFPFSKRTVRGVVLEVGTRSRRLLAPTELRSVGAPGSVVFQDIGYGGGT